VAARILKMCYGFIYTKSQFMPVLSIARELFELFLLERINTGLHGFKIF